MLIKTNNLTLLYKDGKKTLSAVDHVNLEIPEKGMFGISGPSGSGKTSLLYLLSGLRKPTEGSAFYSDINMSSKNGSILRKSEMGFVFQFHFLVNYLDTRRNIMLGCGKAEKDTKTLVRNLIEKLDLIGLEKRKPFELSGGQRQRVAIARALANHPKVLFVDEPVASLDKESASHVTAILEQLAQDVCVIVVSHDESIFTHATQIFKMHFGQLV